EGPGPLASPEGAGGRDARGHGARPAGPPPPRGAGRAGRDGRGGRDPGIRGADRPGADRAPRGDRPPAAEHPLQRARAARLPGLRAAPLVAPLVPTGILRPALLEGGRPEDGPRPECHPWRAGPAACPRRDAALAPFAPARARLLPVVVRAAPA